MKMPIEWHEKQLMALKKSSDDAVIKYVEASEKLRRLSTEVTFLINQIKEAKRQGKDGFDAERFLKGRERR